MNQDKMQLVLGRIDFLKTGEKLMLAECFSSPEELLRLSRQDLESLTGRRVLKKEISFREALEAAEKDLTLIEKGRIGLLCFTDHRYPALLREIYDPPFLLYFRGRLPDWTVPLVGIVGTRHPSGKARSEAFKLAQELSSRGIGVVSGLARGIDSEAHLGSLEGHGALVAVLGNGIDAVYPASNRALAAKILGAGGVILSEYAPGIPPAPYHFPKRNRIISGLSRSLVIVQAPMRSGALITVEYALDQGRDIYVHRVGAESGGTDVSAGTARLAEEGALVVEGAEDLYRDWELRFPDSYRNYSCPGAGDPGDKMPPGRRVAEMVRQELYGEYITHNGEYFRRS